MTRDARNGRYNGRMNPLALRRLVAIAALAAAPCALAQVAVMDPWVRGTVAGQTGTGAYMQLKSATDVAVVGVASPVAGIAEIHDMKMDGTVMRMAAVRRLELPANRIVDLKPGGLHVMLMALKRPLKDGERVPITLTVEDKAGQRFTVAVDAPVRPLAAPAPSQHKH